ncbi:RAMP superfamily CRISPR-associated protein [Roseburia zhanii]|nr:RAMP superfamily CRISPR-associated protein [Roseburia zhanii]
MKYIRYIVKNDEPLRIADDSTSQNGQTVTLRYIPGTTIRGYIVNQLVYTLGEQFDKYKRDLISGQIVYMNAYLYENNRELLPSPKGFYEDKTVVTEKKEIQNVVINGEFDDGNKRAGLGKFCYFKDQCIYYYNVETGSDMKILINKRKQDDKQNVFRNEYITSGHTFVGYIKVDDEELAKAILEVFQKNIFLGNARSQGLGKCRVLDIKEMPEDFIPYQEYAVTDDAENTCYMMLLSNTAMRDNRGEYVGLDLKYLEEKLGVSNLRIEYCSTSTVNVKGYNRAWGSKIPSITMYEQGSVFKLKFDGSASLENMLKIMQSGLGVRKSEGFGRVLFLKDYENIRFKMEEKHRAEDFTQESPNGNDMQDLKILASNYYKKEIIQAMQEKIAKEMQEDKAFSVNAINLNNSQIGNVRGLLEANRYDAYGTETIKRYFAHAMEKEQNTNVQKQKSSIKALKDTILPILDQPLEQTLGMKHFTKIMGISVDELISEEELQRMKIDYILELMKFDNRKGVK